MQKDLDAVYRWAEKKKRYLMKKKFEQMVHGPLKGVTIEPYKTSSGEDIEIKETVKDLGVLATNDLRGAVRENQPKLKKIWKVTSNRLLSNFVYVMYMSRM